MVALFELSSMEGGADSSAGLGSAPSEGWSSWRKRAFNFSTSSKVENAMAFIITFNVVLMWWEINVRGACKQQDDVADEECKAPNGVSVCNMLLLLIYAIELSIRVFAYRWRFFFKVFNCFETFIVLLGFIDWGLSLDPDARFPNLMFLRLFRLFKLLRTVQLLQHFPQLYDLLHGLVSAAYAMLGGAVLICFMLAVWSMLAVELAPPRSEHHTKFDGEALDEWCHTAFSSVGYAMLFFFQTLIAGDSWGTCAIPMIRHSPITVAVFLGSLITIELGVLNLILAVIVESAASDREKDQKRKQRRKEDNEREGLEKWQAMVQQIDRDGSGTISLEELMTGFEEHPETKEFLDLLEVDQKGMRELFELLDHDCSGDLNYDEFFNNLQKAQSKDNRMFLLTMKLQISHITRILREQLLLAGSGTESLPNDGSLLTRRPTRKLTASNPPGREGNDSKVEDELASEWRAWRAGVSPGKLTANIVQVTDPELNKLQAQLDQLTQDTGAQAEMLVQNTTMLEALLASCNVASLPKTAQFSSPRSRQQLGQVKGEAEDASESLGGTQAKMAKQNKSGAPVSGALVSGALVSGAPVCDASEGSEPVSDPGRL